MVASATEVTLSNASAQTMTTAGGDFRLGFNQVPAYAGADAAPSSETVSNLLATHAGVAGALTPRRTQGIGVGTMGGLSNYGEVGGDDFVLDTRYTFTVGTNTRLVLGLLDFVGSGDGGAVTLDFSVSNFGRTLVAQSFDSLAGAEAFFSDNPLLLGRFSGAVDLLVSFSLSSETTQQAAFDYLLATDGGSSSTSAGWLAAAVPEPSQWAMLLAGIGLLGWVARRTRQA